MVASKKRNLHIYNKTNGGALLMDANAFTKMMQWISTFINNIVNLFKELQSTLQDLLGNADDTTTEAPAAAE